MYIYFTASRTMSAAKPSQRVSPDLKRINILVCENIEDIYFLHII